MKNRLIEVKSIRPKRPEKAGNSVTSCRPFPIKEYWTLENCAAPFHWSTIHNPRDSSYRKAPSTVRISSGSILSPLCPAIILPLQAEQYFRGMLQCHGSVVDNSPGARNDKQNHPWKGSHSQLHESSRGLLNSSVARTNRSILLPNLILSLSSMNTARTPLYIRRLSMSNSGSG